ncbi:MAG: hypothetical protein J3K34DRAFT_481938 [Monoraphidium minutum]|nr:MAG: hypothetical protein J3K34DRAFT_481938 [Monoraphidium minutum]
MSQGTMYTRVLMGADAGTCKLVIRTTASHAPTDAALHLAEVQLFGAQGRQIDPSLLSFKMSSTATWAGVPMSAGYCNDGAVASLIFLSEGVPNRGRGQICHSRFVPDDTSPNLEVAYPCSAGLSTVVVTNRQDCCGDRIDAFSLDFVASNGAVTQTYAFTGGNTTNTYTIPKGCTTPGFKTDVSDCSQCMPGRGGKRCRPCGGKNRWSPGGSLAKCRKCPKFAATASADKSSCVCSDTQLEFRGLECAEACTGGLVRDPSTGDCVCGPGFKRSTACDECLPGYGGKHCERCAGVNEWSPGGGLEDCRKCPKVAPTASADKTSCVCLAPDLEFTGHDCIRPCAGTCKVAIRPTASPAPVGTVLNLAEVQLFDAASKQIDRSLLNFKLSSSMIWADIPLSASYCNDGATTSLIFKSESVPNIGQGQICQSKPVPSDLSPRLEISYRCASGLSKVVVSNRQDCCGERINAFSLDFIANSGVVTQTHAFMGGGSTGSYTILKTCGPGFKDLHGCNECLPGCGGPRCEPCYDITEWSPGGSLEACRTCPAAIAPTASADKSSCVCLNSTLEFVGRECLELCAGGGARNPLTGICGGCKVVIRPTASPAPLGAVLNLAEVQLFDAASRQIDRSLLNFKLSSTETWAGVPLSAGYCNDGDTSSVIWAGNVPNTGRGQICQTHPGDPSPRLEVGYSCSAGLSTVVVHNRRDCCGDRTDAFSLDVVASNGTVTQTYAFTGGATTGIYAIPAREFEATSDTCGQGEVR